LNLGLDRRRFEPGREIVGSGAGGGVSGAGHGNGVRDAGLEGRSLRRRA
jgi:hypothetical protein